MLGEGVSLRVIKAGQGGSTLVFIPGWSTGADIWQRQIETFAKTGHVISFDPRSQGESTKTTSGNTPEMCAGPPAAVHNLSGRNSQANFLGKISRAMRRNFSLCCRMESATTNRANRATAFMRNFRAMDASAWWKRSIGCLPRGSALITRTS
jgi:pimeloyl-ACP methyl ester carboxylesterase